jgi:hypothetical protein
MTQNTRVTLPPESTRQLSILSAFREVSGTSLVLEMIAREYTRLGLEEDDLRQSDWKAQEAR